jgi:hypothetical protein
MVSLARVTRLRKRNERLGIGMPGNNDVILDVARAFKDTVDAPVLGGIAVYLHGYPRATTDLDLYTDDRERTDRQLRAAGAVWDTRNREHVLDGVRIHTVTPDEAKHEVQKTSVIDGVRVVSLKDLVAIKLICGWGHPGLTKHVADVVELVREVPLNSSYARHLPSRLRRPFTQISRAVRDARRARRNLPRF